MLRVACVIVMLAACHRTFVDDGELGGPCLPDGTCADGLTCVADMCRGGQSVTDAPRDTPGTPPADALCTDNSEPNESLGTATVTTVDGVKNLAYIALAICPATDIDVFRVSIGTANEALEAIVDYQNASSGIFMSILNSGGVAIANATATAQPKRLRAYAPNLPVGTYYVQVRTNLVYAARCVASEP